MTALVCWRCDTGERDSANGELVADHITHHEHYGDAAHVGCLKAALDGRACVLCERTDPNLCGGLVPFGAGLAHNGCIADHEQRAADDHEAMAS